MFINVEKLSEVVFSSELIAEGGDHRILIDEQTGLNAYGSKISPTNLLPYGSCTANNISREASLELNQLIKELNLQRNNSNFINVVLKKIVEDTRTFLVDFFNLPSSTLITFGPSGTDLEYLAILIAGIKKDNPVHNLIMLPDEVGSGTRNAANGRFFSNIIPKGQKVEIGGEIEGIYNPKNTFVSKGIRNGIGEPFKSSEDLFTEIREEVIKAISKKQSSLVHFIHSSKTGLITLSPYHAKKLTNDFGENITIVVDACQGRISSSCINDYLKVGAHVMITGSKFFGGPPFCAALLSPYDQLTNLKKIKSSGLNLFYSKYDFPTKAQENKEDKLLNVGLYFRWYAARFEMQQFKDHSKKLIMDIFFDYKYFILEKIKSAKHLYLIESSLDKTNDKKNLFDTQSIYNIGMLDKNNLPITSSEARNIQVKLAKLRQSKKIQLGQPVPFEGQIGNLRLAIGAQNINMLAKLQKPERKLRIKDDINHIIKMLDSFAKGVEVD